MTGGHWHVGWLLQRPGKEMRRIAAYASFELMLGLRVPRPIAFDLAFRWFAR